MLKEYQEEAGYKFQDAFTVVLWDITMLSGQDEHDGDCVDGPAWVARIGRHIVGSTPTGFVWRDKIDKGDEMHLWAYIEANMPDLAAWILDEDHPERQW